MQAHSATAIDALRAVDLIFGCVDNDGARLVLNELSIAVNIPYLDLAVQIDASDGIVTTAAGRGTVAQLGGPLL